MMKSFGKIVSVVCLSLMAAVLAKAADENKEEVAKFKGTWGAVSYVENGNGEGETGPADESGVRWVFKGDKVTWLADVEGASLEGSFKLDPKSKPKTIDFTFPPTPDSKKSTTILGIYEIEGDTLKICYGTDQGVTDEGVKRPTEFKSKPKSSRVMIVFKNVTKDDPVEEEMKKFQGTWTRIYVEADGKKSEDGKKKQEKAIKLIINGDKYGAETFKLDPTKTPKQINVLTVDDKGKATTLPGIYELKGDVLKLCFPFPFNEKSDKIGKRPTEFGSKPGGNDVLEVYNREKK